MVTIEHAFKIKTMSKAFATSSAGQTYVVLSARLEEIEIQILWKFELKASLLTFQEKKLIIFARNSL